MAAVIMAAAATVKPTKERLLNVLDDLEVLSRELIEMLALSRSQKLPQPGEDTQILELLVQRDREFQDLMEVAQRQGKVHQEMQQLEKEVEKRDSDIQQLQKQLKEAEHILATAVYQAKEKLKSIERARKLSAGMLPPHHAGDFGLEPPGHNKENEDDVEAMSTDSSSSSSDSD
ncbi:mediator of RNA polymerase II transcription subunit 4 [Hippocampus comes]|uniref:mediator of RNA polymerase II transcription subunit 4 n=1 Tax=Hippocampus comes TaxID=109280 RepID=UPI00094EF13A|nr:PREDICTED: mediator of RNA polymerase II transcription subunit 4-like [Hippocampus comes]